MLYLDTSVLITALTNEPRTAETQTWLAAQNPDELIISDWVVTEISSALSIKLRTGQLTEDDFSRMSMAIGKMYQSKLTIDDRPGLSIAQMRARVR